MKKLTFKTILILTSFLLFLSFQNNSYAQLKTDDYKNNWPSWRGINNTGATVASNLPTEFSETKNIKWKVDIPGKGHATPIIWKDQMIVLTAVPTDKKPEKTDDDATEETGRRGPPANKTDVFHNFMVISIDKNTGHKNWEKVVKNEIPQESTHNLGSWASNSPVTDGENIYAYFGSRGLFCLDFEGNIKWERDFGQMEKVMSFGEGSSAAVYGNKVVVQWDHQGESFIYVLNKNTGKDIWSKERDEISSWATPLIMEVNGTTQVITGATNKVRSYDLETGEIIWESTGMTRNVIPNPMYANGILYLMSGFRGNALHAIDLAKAKGNITGTDAILWEYNQDAPYTPCATLMDGKLYFLRANNGIMTCLNAKNGEVLYSNQKLDGINNIFSSPTGADNKIYIAATNKINVVKAGPEFEILSVNELDDTFHASPIMVGDKIYLRGFKSLYCISEE